MSFFTNHFACIDFVLRAYISANIDPVPLKYKYPHERALNPGYQSLKQKVEPLGPNEKRIFALLDDFNLVSGIKNSKEYAYTGLEEAFEESLHPYIDWNDRYGHPSLIVPEERDFRRVFSAGFVCQREGYLQVFLSSGRYNRDGREDEAVLSLTVEQTALLESYLCFYFFQAYPNQKIIFYDTYSGKQDEEDSLLFFADKPFPDTKGKREYTVNSIKKNYALALEKSNLLPAFDYIRRNITPLKPSYAYENEKAINPGYQTIENAMPLALYEKRIWALRSDGILSLGVKNAYEEQYGYKGFKAAFNPSLHRFIGFEDRYGHRSIALPEDNYNGEVYYAGYICQRPKHLQVYLVSGRFDRKDLHEAPQAVLEAYIAALFQAAFGKQDIVFDFGDPDNSYYHSTFFADKNFHKDNPRRIYTTADIQNILKNLSEKEYIIDKDNPGPSTMTCGGSA